MDFLKALTDDRVRYERAPFDHPAICVPSGCAATAEAELFTFVPSIGRGGNPVPLQTFAEQLLGIRRWITRACGAAVVCVLKNAH